MLKTYPLEQLCGYTGIKTRTSLAVNKKSDNADVVWSQLAMELHASEHSERIAVYTDGSVKHGNAACAVYSSHFKLFSRLKNGTSISHRN